MKGLSFSLRGAYVLLCGGVAVLACVAASGVWSVWLGAPFSAYALSLMAGVTVVILVLSVCAAYILIQPVRRRLYEIEEAAALLAAGHLHHRIPDMGDSDEIGQLAKQFNIMGDRLAQQVGLLQKLAEENQTLTSEAERAAVLEERQRLARELHDSVSQQLFGMSMLSASLQRQFDAGKIDAAAKTCSKLTELATSAQREMRALLLQLRPVELEGRPLGEAVRHFLSAVADRHDITCTFEGRVQGRLPAAVEGELFRILQEAVANVLKHAGATQLHVSLTDSETGVSMTVTDNGSGIPEDAMEKAANTYGLKAMAERAEALGGRCDVWNRNPGTAVRVQIPMVGDEEKCQ